MIKALLAASVLVGAMALPAAAAPLDPIVTGGRGHAPSWSEGRNDRHDRYERHRAVRLSPWQVERQLRHRGYRNVDVVQSNRNVLVVRAAAKGRSYILTVDARSGDILRSQAVSRAPGWRR